MKESHYNKGGIEVIDFIRDQLTPEEFNGFCKGNILKYVPRSNHKGDPIADAQKVRDYADYWINANLRVIKLGQVSTEKAQELADTIVELRRDNAELKEEINELKDELRKSEEENVEASRERLNSVKMAEALRESVDRLQKENAEIEEKEVVIESLESQVEALLTEVKQREAENKKLKKDLGLSLPHKQEPPMSDAEFNKDYAKFVEVQAQHEPPISNIDPSGRIAPADDAPDIDARFLSTDDDDGLPRIRY